MSGGCGGLESCVTYSQPTVQMCGGLATGTHKPCMLHANTLSLLTFPCRASH